MPKSVQILTLGALVIALVAAFFAGDRVGYTAGGVAGSNFARRHDAIALAAITRPARFAPCHQIPTAHDREAAAFSCIGALQRAIGDVDRLGSDAAGVNYAFGDGTSRLHLLPSGRYQSLWYDDALGTPPHWVVGEQGTFRVFAGRVIVTPNGGFPVTLRVIQRDGGRWFADDEHTFQAIPANVRFTALGVCYAGTAGCPK